MDLALATEQTMRMHPFGLQLNDPLTTSGESIIEINKILINKFGKPKRKLDSDPLDILIATILSQNTNDRNSHEAYLQLKRKFPTWSKLLSASTKQIAKVIKSAGLNNQKTKTIKTFLTELKNGKGKFSLSYLKKFSNEEVISELTSFNGIGVKTASCVLLFGMRREVCPVDTHVFRVINRIGIVKANNPEKTFFELNKILPTYHTKAMAWQEGIAHSLHTNLIKLGRTICKSQNPNCIVCPIIKHCSYNNKNLFPAKNKPVVSKANDFMLLDVV